MDRSELTYVLDKDGSEYACPVSVLEGDFSRTHELSEEEKRFCIAMSESIDVFNG